MIVARTRAALDAALAPRRTAGRVAFVPTMGALHEGHAALFRAAAAEGACVVASVFVNPAQFDDPQDLAAYPRTETEDAATAKAAGVDVLFAPAAGEIYPAGQATSINVTGAAIGFEGALRPGHFDGVALVCVKLFNLVAPHAAWFGQKDAQQVAVIRQVVRDLNLLPEIRVGQTVRDADGLALSSRNRRLSREDRERAGAIPAALHAGLAAHRAGRPAVDVGAAARAPLSAAGLAIDYADVAMFDGDATLVVAVRCGATRLIDNVPLNDPARAGLSSGSAPGR